MCLLSCFGFHKHRDDWDATPIRDAPPAATKPAAPRGGYGAPQVTYNVNGGVHRASPYQTAAADAAEAGHKAANDMRKFPATHAAAEALKQPAARVAGEAAGHGAQQQHHYNYYEREPVHREDAMDYRYSTATATTDHERY